MFNGAQDRQQCAGGQKRADDKQAGIKPMDFGGAKHWRSDSVFFSAFNPQKARSGFALASLQRFHGVSVRQRSVIGRHGTDKIAGVIAITRAFVMGLLREGAKRAGAVNFLILV